MLATCRASGGKRSGNGHRMDVSEFHVLGVTVHLIAPAHFEIAQMNLRVLVQRSEPSDSDFQVAAIVPIAIRMMAVGTTAATVPIAARSGDLAK